MRYYRNLIQKSLFAFCLLLIANIQSFTARADEGMWLPLLIERLNHTDMQAKGLKLTAEEIYSVNHSSLKDAIVGLCKLDNPTDFFCTAEVISKDGLLLTNHHCGFEAVQQHSSVESNYLANGFWAMSRLEELPNEGMGAAFLVRMEDVTQRILSEMKKADSPEMAEMMKEFIIEELKKENSENGTYVVSVKSFFQGNEYYMFVYKVYRDVRLVGAPPASIGKFGGDTDNWMWPRHTGDFSLLRVYTNKAGEPADYSPNNFPLISRYYLPISLKGTENGDFAMIMGYPGQTERYLNSTGVMEAINEKGPAIVKIRTEKLRLMKEDMDADPAIKIKYASKYASTSNYWKYYIGQTEQLKRNKVVDKKKNLEKAFSDWVNANEERKTEYGDALKWIEEGLAEQKKYSKALTYIDEAVFQGSEIFYQVLTSGLYQIYQSWELFSKNEALLSLFFISIYTQMQPFYKDFSTTTDKKLFISLLKMYQNDIPEELHPEEFNIIKKKFKNDFNKYAEYVYAKSIFTDEKRFASFIEKPNSKVLGNDPFLKLLASFIELYQKIEEQTASAQKKEQQGYQLFIKGLREMQPDKKFYPDANSTMRLTYGNVKDYYPADAKHYDYYTTLEGIIEKNNPNDEDFQVPTKLIKLYKEKDYGRYSDKDGRMRVCFLTTNDITGGNSGSPVINGNGELIGCAFDGNWEAMSGDIWYEPELQRTICVDIRYILFIIDKYAGAGYLLNEMKIIE